MLLAALVALFGARLLELALDTVQLVNQAQCHVGPTNLALWLYLLRFDEFAPRMSPAGQAFDTRLGSHSVVAGVVVGHQVAAIASKQAQWCFLRTAG